MKHIAFRIKFPGRVVTAYALGVFGLLAITLSSIIGYTGQAQAAAGIYKTINFQGKVVNTNGTNVADASYTFRFRIYNHATNDATNTCSANSCLWEESKSITTVNGIFQTNLGDVTALPGSVNFNTDTLHIGVLFNGDTEMTPRIRLTSVPYAFNADMLDGLDSTALVQLSPSGAQTGTINVTGNITSGGAVGAAAFDAATASTALVLGSANANTITLAKNTTMSGSFTMSLQGNNALSLGSSSAAGGIIFKDGTANNRSATLSTVGLTASYTLNLPTTAPASGALCLQTAAGSTTDLSFGNCSGGAANFVSLQATSPGTADTGNLNISGIGIATAWNATSYDRTNAGLLNIGTTNATQMTISKGGVNVTVAGNLIVQDVSVAAGKTISFVAGAGAFDASLATGVFKTSTGAATLNGDTSVVSGKNFTVLGGITTLQPASDIITTPDLLIKTSAGNNIFSVAASSSFTRMGFNLGSTNLPSIVGNGFELQGALRLTGGASSNMTDTYTTPVGSSVGTKINIPIYDPGAFGQILAFGLPSTANSSSRTLSLFDARTAAHQPTIGVFSPDEANLIGFSWDGSNSIASIKNTGATIALNANGINVFTAANSSGTAVLTIGANGVIQGSAANALTVAGGTANALNLNGGAASVTNTNGANVVLSGGAGNGTGVQGLVALSTSAFTASSLQTNSITAGIVDQFSSIPVTANSVGLTINIPAPVGAVTGRVLYVTGANGSLDFTILLAGTSISIGMKANSTATLIWNGTGWTAAGASSSTDLQSAYNNTLTSAGGAELVLNPSGGNADGFTIRNNGTTPISGGLLEVQTSIGNNLLSVNYNGTELAANGGAETSSSFATDWTTVGAPTITRHTTLANVATGQASVQVSSTAAANTGVRNNLNANPTVSSTYQVSFTGKLSSGTFSTLNVQYSRDGGTTLAACSNYSTTTLVTTGWSKVTCTFATDATTATNPDLIIRQTDATSRIFWIDNLSVTIITATSTPPNVQIGGGLYGGAATVLTLDRASTAPVVNGNTALLGSMYYDTTSGRIQCYEADGWGACGSSPDNYVNLVPEYGGAVLDGSGVGTLTADFCASQVGVLSVNATLCSTGQALNYYKWTSPQATQQTYSIYVSYQLPAAFKQFQSDTTIQLTARTDNTTNGIVTYEMFRSEGGALSACGTETTVTSTINTWQTVGINGNELTSCGFSATSANNFAIFKINVKANSNANVYVGTLSFTTTGQ